ncbi:hypothetical protein ACIF8T_38910 [Streptomyces sp. NPDC085946]|uniref:hypothetical protein n=1 Tax=Streptomyces sp. NPDC085946 TaxID=3365744 RepID=UPI0037D8D890
MDDAQSTGMYDVERTGIFGDAPRGGPRAGNPATDIEAVLNAVFGTAEGTGETRRNDTGGRFPAHFPG